jgi:hypothetical protein
MQKISKLKPKQTRLKIDSSDVLPLAFLGLSVASVCSAIAILWLAVSFSKLVNKPSPTLVQQVDGKAFIVRPEEHNYREPELIRKTVTDWAVMTFSWGTVSDAKPSKQKSSADSGVDVGGRKKVPRSTWEASFLLTPDFRDAFLDKLAKDVIPAGVFDGKVSQVFVPQSVSPPQAAGMGRWKVDMVATRILFDGVNPSGHAIPINRTFYVRASDPPTTPLKENANEYQRVVYQMLAAGLQIEEIRPLDAEGMTTDGK